MAGALGGAGVWLGKQSDKTNEESLIRKTEHLRSNVKNVINNVNIKAELSGVKDAEAFVKQLQQFGLTFSERSDSIYTNDNERERLAFGPE